jgi:Flp pilus assembly protein TadD
LAKSLIHVGAVDAALPYLERAHAAFPDDRDTRLTLALAYRDRGREDRASEILRGIDLDPEERVRMDLAVSSLAVDEGRPLDAIAPLERATGARPGDGLLWAMLGKANLDAKQYPQAATAFRRAAERSPRKADYWVGLGHASAMARDDAGALNAYAEALRLDPNLFEIDYNVGVLLSRSGDANGATARFREALRLQPDYAPARNALEALEPRP